MKRRPPQWPAVRPGAAAAARPAAGEGDRSSSRPRSARATTSRYAGAASLAPPDPPRPLNATIIGLRARREKRPLLHGILQRFGSDGAAGADSPPGAKLPDHLG